MEFYLKQHIEHYGTNVYWDAIELPNSHGMVL